MSAPLPSQLRFDSAGLIPAVVQDHLSGQVRMVAFMNRESLAQTLRTGKACFYSRSRKRLWVKGETSGNELLVREVRTDCDADCIVLSVDPQGPSCHTGEISCFYAEVGPAESTSTAARQAPFLQSFEEELAARKSSVSEKSYTKSLLDAGEAKIAAKIREEAGELAEALEGESNERVLSEAADLLYHVAVGLLARGLNFPRVFQVLRKRSGLSGLAEKAQRTEPGRNSAGA